ncbi:MAG: hypothetical protein LBJ38_01430 [Oscillospiraceae bacterium]|nr:hypothetical protein [Oscillospiraceae bacterium]
MVWQKKERPLLATPRRKIIPAINISTRSEYATGAISIMGELGGNINIIECINADGKANADNFGRHKKGF